MLFIPRCFTRLLTKMEWLVLAWLFAGSLQAKDAVPVEAEDGMPPLYHKITLAGRPFGDPMPQDRIRSDSEPEQNYVDAMTLRLQSRTTDIYVTIMQSDFALAVTRNVEGSVWLPDRGLTPAQRPDLPFGNCWSSGLAANVHLTEAEVADPVRVSVTDEQGIIHSFAAAPGERQYIPLPSTRSDQDWAQMKLSRSKAGEFVLQRKFGTVLVFRAEPSVVLMASHNGKPERHSFFRLVSVSDRFGSKIDYVFDESNHGVIPNEIAYRTQRVRVEVNKEGRVERIIDPAGGDRLYEYRASTQPSGTPLLVTQRQQLTGETRAASHYEYEEAIEGAANAPSAWHCNVSLISDPRGNTYRFTYAPDTSRPGPGALRCVSRVTLPGSSGETRFFNYSNLAPKLAGARRVTFVTDALGNGRLYEFVDNQVARFASAKGDVTLARVMWPGEQVVSHFSGSEHEFSAADGKVTPKGATTLLARETYTFDADAGLVLKKATDGSGNTREFAYDDLLTADWRKIVAPSPVAVHCADPTRFTDPLGAVARYTYDPAFRLLTRTTDAAGRITCRLLAEPCARLISARVYADAGKLDHDEPFTRTDFEYARKDFPGFVTRKIIRKTTTSPETLPWEHDLVTSFDCDDLGKTVLETADPDGLKQTKASAYDENGNKRSVTFANGYQIDFKYDGVNHLTRVFRPTSKSESGRSARIYEYNLGGDKTKEVEPDGTTRTFDYDELNRQIRQTEYSPGDYPRKPRRIVEQRYNAAGYELQGMDDKGQTYFREFDALQRIKKITYDDHSFVTFGYGKNCGDALFKSSVWKATTRSLNGALATGVHYDAAGWQEEVLSLADRDAGAPRQTRFRYDAVGNLLAKIESTGGETTFEYDPLNRLVKTVFPDGKTERILFTSTGLKYATVSASGKRTEQAFDAAGEPLEKEK